MPHAISGKAAGSRRCHGDCYGDCYGVHEPSEDGDLGLWPRAKFKWSSVNHLSGIYQLTAQNFIITKEIK